MAASMPPISNEPRVKRFCWKVNQERTPDMAKNTTTGLFPDEKEAASEGPVECLGTTFPTDTVRRTYYTEKLRKKLKDPKFRRIEGFPIGEDEDILALSDPPYYTACPNPFLEDFIRQYSTKLDKKSGNSNREPFTADVSEGKSDSMYTAHSYHTKVPYKAIMRYILHYTEAGSVVLDGFSGTGMTGVAAQLCGNRGEVESLGYTVKPDGGIFDGKTRISQIGERACVLNDLSPVASFVAYNYNVPTYVPDFQAAARNLLELFDSEYGWMYRTHHEDGRIGRLNYVVWSDVFACNHCQGEIVFWNEAVEDGEIKEETTCPHCKATVSKRSLDRMTTTEFDKTAGMAVQKAKRIPVVINYSVDGQKFEKEPDEKDLAVLRKIAKESIPGWFPTKRIDEDIDLWYERDYRSLGIYTIEAFFERRALIMVSFFHEKIAKHEGRLRGFLWFWFQSVLMGFSLLNRYLKNAYSQVNRLLSGTLYVGAMHSEVSPWYSLEGKIQRLRVFDIIKSRRCIVSTGSTAMLDIPEDSIDYIFTDPPFGSNIIYSDLNILWESWLNLFTNTDQENVVHRRKKAGAFTLIDYTRMMTACFHVMRKALKPGHWITVEFHNSKNSVWNSIQEALLQAGFVVADVRTLDKQMGSFKQVTAAGAVKQDLVISAYKPSEQLEKQFLVKAGSEAGAWQFVDNHLGQLPVFVSRNGKAEVIAERQNYLLFDRMVAFHIQHGATVPLSAAEFYGGLSQRYPERDGMFFLPNQATAYDQKRLEVREVEQFELFVNDEKSAIQWVRRHLSQQPMTYRDLQPIYMKEAQRVWEKHEQPLELRAILEQNFIEDKNGKWRVPDSKKDADLEQVRHQFLLKEFEQYLSSKSKLKIIRMEALRAGFKDCWQQKDYVTIIQMAKRVPEEVIQEDSALLMYFDNASLLVGE
jgi:DNA modification methylase